ncbi:MAG: KilA-N domain-containing protein [Candidatus Nanopelagicaceae bacterium]
MGGTNTVHPTKQMNNLSYNGQKISQRQDGYINGTEMAKANDVRINNWTQTDDFKRYQTAISAKTGIPAMVLVNTSSDSRGTKTTWLHPDMAIKFGRWISVDFEIWCDNHIKTLMEKGKTKLVEEPLTRRQIAEQLLAAEIELEKAEEQLALAQTEIEVQAEIIDELFDYSSIIRVAKYNKCDEKAFTWRKLKAASITLGLEIKSAPCPRYGTKLLYPHEAWEYVYPEAKLPEATNLASA